MKEAMLYEKLNGSVKCSLCSHRCTIADGKRGICGVRENKGGILYSLVYGKAVAAHVDPVEKKPFFHFRPGSLSYSIATVGCNFRCKHCQNWDISQVPGDGGILGEDLEPERIVELAKQSSCESIAYTYTEPTIFFEYAYDTSKLAKREGIDNIFVTNGFMTEESLKDIKPYLDAANVDLKGFTEKFYREVCGARLEPVLDSLKRMKKLGVWVEVTTLVIPSLNDSLDELRGIAEFIRNELGEETPWHISRFYPQYKLKHLPQTDMEVIHKARKIGLDAGLRYVYAGNLPGDSGENTYCFNCNELLVKRYAFSILENKIVDSKCPVCGAKIDGVGL
ncbi:MAG: AmmeMemoRadiSam system radical SAM enzyme [Candidatus Altiarchaeota archaeon]|nr:AmmeMemoRadiSam system radical SAM enzyme [Candidatus Altiarchaeota archaeon]